LVSRFFAVRGNILTNIPVSPGSPPRSDLEGESPICLSSSFVRRLSRVCGSQFFGWIGKQVRSECATAQDSRNHCLRLEPLEDRRMLSTVFYDSFSGSHPGSWEIGHDGGGGDYAWAWPNDYAHCYSHPTAGSYYYPDDLHVYMERRGVSLSGYDSASLSFSHVVDTESGYDSFTVNVPASRRIGP